METRLLLTIRVEVAVDDEQLLIDALRESPRGSAPGVHTVRPTTALMTLLKTDAITQAIQTVPGVRPVGGEVDVVPDDGQDHPWGPELPESVAWYRHTGVSRTL